MKTKLLSTSHHRNGITGDPFDVSLFIDEDGSTKVSVDFGGSSFAVLQVDKLAAGSVAFGDNSWRGDNYAGTIRALAKKAEDSFSPDSLYIRHKDKS